MKVEEMFWNREDNSNDPLEQNVANGLGEM